MKKSWLKFMPLFGLLGGLVMTAGCSSSLSSVGGADLRLEGLTLGTVTMEGKPVEGIPSNAVNLLLDVSARTVVVSSTEDGGILLTAEPSEATVEITKDGISINGLDAKKLTSTLRDEYQIILSGGQQTLSGKIFRIGHMGWVNEKDIKAVITAIKAVLPKVGFVRG